MSPSSHRIASLLPGLTDHVTQLGLGEYLVARTHECTFLDSSSSTSVTYPKLMVDSSVSPAELSAGWSTTRNLECLSDVQLSTHVCSYYRVDVGALASLTPTILLTCLRRPGSAFGDGPGLDELRAAIMHAIPSLRAIHNIDPCTISEIYAASSLISSSFTGVTTTDAIGNSRKHMARIEQSSSPRYVPPRVAVVQWDDPIYLAGGWIPEAIAAAGGTAAMETAPGGPSVTVGTSDLVRADVIVFAICAVGLAGCTMRARKFVERHSNSLRNSDNSATRVVGVDASINFSRPSLSALVDTTQLIADIINRTASNAEWTEVTNTRESPISTSTSQSRLRERVLDPLSIRSRT